MGRKRILGVALALALALGTTSCAEVWWWIGGGTAATFIVPNSRLDPLYHRKYHGAGLLPITEAADSPLLGFVEFDDFGWYRDRQQPRELLRQLQELTSNQNTVVVLYIHGWRHNSSDSDTDMKAFRTTLSYLKAELDGPAFRTVRNAVSGQTGARLVGIAVGWRGQAWPEMQRWLPVVGHVVDAPVYPSAFGRKQTAQVIGQGDLQDFVSNLADLHADRWAQARRSEPAPLMTLVMVGHSFGGHALFDAMRERIEASLTTAIVGAHVSKKEGMAERAVPVAARLDRLPDATSAPVPDTCRRIVGSIGDLVVLINPAIEAASYKTVDALVHSARFRREQPPVLLTISSKNDGARNIVFRGLRFFTLFGRASLGGQQRRMERLALGAYPEHHTNRLDLIDNSKEARSRARRRVKAQPSTDMPSLTRDLDPDALREMLPEIQDRDLSNALDLGNVRLFPVPTGVRHSPALVVNTSSTLVNGHSDFFREEFIRWLSGYVLQIQLKRLANSNKLHSLGQKPAAAE